MPEPAMRVMSPTIPAPTAVSDWVVCPMWGPAGGILLWPHLYRAAYEAAVLAARQDLLRRQWWEPSLN